MLLTPLVFVAALTLEVLGSYMSVIGLSSKSSLVLIVLAIALDFSKIVVASVLYKNWKGLNFLLRSFLLPTTIFLMVITSYGAYAYLLQEFGKTTANGEQISTKLALMEEEAQKVNARKKEIDAQIAAVDPMFVSQKRRLNTMFSKELEYLNERSIQLDKEIPILKSSQMTDNLQAGTLGSLAKSWGTTPDQTAKIIALMMVIVIDPLAIVMLIVGNFLIMQREEQKKILAFQKEQRQKEERDHELQVQHLASLHKPQHVEVPDFPTEEAKFEVQTAIAEVEAKAIIAEVEANSFNEKVTIKEHVASNEEIMSVANSDFNEEEVLLVANGEDLVIEINEQVPNFNLMEQVWIEKPELTAVNFIGVQQYNAFKGDNDSIYEAIVDKYPMVLKEVNDAPEVVPFWEEGMIEKYPVEMKEEIQPLMVESEAVVEEKQDEIQLLVENDSVVEMKEIIPQTVEQSVSKKKFEADSSSSEKNSLEEVSTQQPEEFVEEKVEVEQIVEEVLFEQEELPEAFGEIEEDKTSDEYWLKKYGLTQEQMAALERPGDYLLDEETERLLRESSLQGKE